MTETSAFKASTGIHPLKISTLSGDWFTLWAPSWTERGEKWQAVLGKDDQLYVFADAENLLAFIRSGQSHDLLDHPQWGNFAAKGHEALIDARIEKIDLIDVPNKLASRPGYEGTRRVSRAFELLQSLGSLLGVESITSWFRSYSVLQNVKRGADHFASQNGEAEWTGIGRTVIEQWGKMLKDLEDHLYQPESAQSDVKAAKADIAEATTLREERIAAEEKRRKDEATSSQKEQENSDPYDSTLWAQAGIDPIRITLNGQHVYTLRCYLGDSPRFLGRNGQIFTFPNSRSLVRWIVDADEHDLEPLSTWTDLQTAANAGELEVEVHDSNQYVFTGLRDDIASGTDAVDTKQLGRAYELLADAADWAGDDGVNKILIAYPRLQNYIAFMLGSASGTAPSAPFDEEVKGWKALEDDLIKRFSKF